MPAIITLEFALDQEVASTPHSVNYLVAWPWQSPRDWHSSSINKSDHWVQWSQSPTWRESSRLLSTQKKQDHFLELTTEAFFWNSFDSCLNEFDNLPNTFSERENSSMACKWECSIRFILDTTQSFQSENVLLWWIFRVFKSEPWKVDT